MSRSLVHCARFAENAAGELVDVGFDVMISGRTIESDAEFIAWAEEREQHLKRTRAAQVAETARSGGRLRDAFSHSASSPGAEGT